MTDAEILAAVRREGRNTNAFLATYGGYRWFRSASPPGLVGFVLSGRTLVIGGDPLCAPEDAADVLAALARAAGPRRRLALVLASGWLVASLRARGYGAICIGSDPIFDLPDWRLRGRRARAARNAVNRARRAGVAVAAYRANCGRDTEVERELRDCTDAWLGTRRALPMRFLAAVEPLQHAEERRYFVARQAGRVVGFIACAPIPARNGWYLENIVRRPDAPFGVADLLVVAALEALREEGAAIATLGIAPFVGARALGPRQWRANLLRCFARAAAPFYNFAGIRRFKRKFQPSRWEPVYLLFYPDSLTPGLGLDILNAFPPGGLLGMTRAWLAGRVRGRWMRLRRAAIHRRSRAD